MTIAAAGGMAVRHAGLSVRSAWFERRFPIRCKMCGCHYAKTVPDRFGRVKVKQRRGDKSAGKKSNIIFCPNCGAERVIGG